ncbi:MAG: transketolase [Rickettsiales bacterium]|nr:transketolase [Rickettsiales bacterium]
MTAATAPTTDSHVSHQDMANAIRALAMDAVEKAASGHPGMPMGMADVATVLFRDILKYDPKHPNWPDRDRFVLSAGHGSMLQYALLYLTGYEDMTLDEIKNFRQWGAKTAGHPEFGHASGIETTTGPLGQGLANAVGMALAERLLNAEYGNALVDHHTFVIAGDGCLMEGISQEAISMAGHWQLDKLIVLFDDNGISIDGPTSLAVSEDTIKRFESCGWHTQSVDGHDPVAIASAIYNAKASDKPSMIACKTEIGKGAPTKAGKSSSHGAPLGADEIKGARERLGWGHGDFEIPSDVLDAWRAAGAQGGKAFAEWSERLDADAQGDAFARRVSGELPDGWMNAINTLKKQLAENAPKEATRKSSQNVLDALTPHIPAMIGGSADLTGSNNTKAQGQEPVAAPDYKGHYIYYGVREHGMAAAMNGLALHGGFVPYGGTFLVFTDYCRPSIRLSALMQQRVIYVMTHDSIGLGEDGPTHQPVEHVASLRAMPNVQMMRPADATETAECWALAVGSDKAPSVLALSRQGLPHLRNSYTEENLCAYGAYTLAEASDDNPQAVLMGTGSELHLCVEAAEKLREQGVAVRVVSMPCWELFEQQPQSYRDEVLPKDAVKVACEAGIGFGWERYIGENGAFVGMQGFGASAPAGELYKQFGITSDAIIQAVKTRLA